MSDSPKKPLIVFTLYSPYMVVDLGELKMEKGEPIPLAPVTSLCRCGASKSKPHCDGSHGEVGFVGSRDPNAQDRPPREYEGQVIEIIDHRGVCSHSEECIKSLPNVFRKDERPWIEPNAAEVDEVIAAVKRCPSGALSYRIEGRHFKVWDSEPNIFVRKDGPLDVRGVELKDDQGTQPETQDHYALCRCGESKIKPFCDGSHHDAGFKDDKK